LAANKRALDAAVRAGEGDSTNHYADLTAQLQNALSVQSTAQAALALAQGGADAQRLYITTYVKPLMADASTWPNRWLDLLLVVLGSAIVWVIGMLVRNSVMEHGN
jgi:capsule polysaccharide export protein KpsE/RkpR